MIERARAAVADGRSVDEVAALLGVSYSSALNVTRACREVRQRVRQKPDTVAELVKDYLAGGALPDLAEKYGVSLASAYRYTSGLKRERQPKDRKRGKRVRYSRHTAKVVASALSLLVGKTERSEQQQSAEPKSAEPTEAARGYGCDFTLLAIELGRAACVAGGLCLIAMM